ncbi:MAG: DUF86 domain-containing protein [Bacteroidota bacterium]
MSDRLGDKARLLHIVESVDKIESYLGNSTYEDFEGNPMMKDACIRNLGIIGEASNRVSKEIQEQHQEVPWRQIIGLRNIVVHEYFGIDVNIVWDIIKFNLPNLKQQVKNIIEGLDENPA